MSEDGVWYAAMTVICAMVWCFFSVDHQATVEYKTLKIINSERLL